MFLVGIVLVTVVTLVLVFREKYKVFLVYQSGSLDFWQNVNPYADWQHPFDRYLYGPVFSVFFSVFALLPSWLGAILWNLANYCLFYLAVFSLPDMHFHPRQKRFAHWFLFPIALTDLFYFQSNLFVTSLFLIAFSLLERNRQIAAIPVMLFSGFAKIYGLIQLGTLLFYKRLWRNLVIASLVATILFLVPLLKIPFHELLNYYQSWFSAIDQRHDPLNFEVIYRLLHMLGYRSSVDHVAVIQLISLLVICVATLLNYRKFGNFEFRVHVLAVVMGWVILFSTTAEKHTYVIAMAGLVLWYLTSSRTIFDRVLIWSNFLLIILVPIDAIFPKPLMRLLYYQLGLNLILFTFTWLRMFGSTFLTGIKSALLPKES